MVSTGALYLVFRYLFFPLFRKASKEPKTLHPLHQPFVSIIIPARNEGHHLDSLLTSLMNLNYPQVEVIVVDDCSEDDTDQVAARFPVKLIKGEPTPVGWMGKQWACYQGAKKARGEILLFTDADTTHGPDSLARAVAYFQRRKLDLMTAIPYHDSKQPWERLLGPFQLLLLLATRAYSTQPKGRRVFAIGQYLMFSSQHYWNGADHSVVKHCFGEDVPIAQHTLQQGHRFEVFKESSLFKVRMYQSYGNFIQGWRRNFRFARSSYSPIIFLEVTAVVVTFFPYLSENLYYLLPFKGALLLMFALAQGKIGSFHPLGVILFPFSFITLSIILALTSWDMIHRSPFQWKNRQYEIKALAHNKI